jgi:release factor glutamine methyltransferase
MIPVSTIADRPATIAESLRAAVRVLHACGDSPRLDAEILLGNLLGTTRAALVRRGEEVLNADTERAYRELIALRAKGVPVAYLTGIREFWSLPFKVTPAVLVPRPESELLVERALKLLPMVDGAPAVLDLGTGSGVLALALAFERRRARIVGVDISEAAARVARDNAAALGLTQVEWRVGSWFAPVQNERFDLILSNPPYIAAARPAASGTLRGLGRRLDGSRATRLHHRCRALAPRPRRLALGRTWRRSGARSSRAVRAAPF